MDELILRIAAPGLMPIERRLDRALLSIGSDAGADLRLAVVPARWAVIRKSDSGLEVRRVGVAGAMQLATGAPLVLDGIELSLVSRTEPAEEGLPVQSIAEGLASAERADEALASMIDALIAATGASTGAILLHEPDGYTVPVARHADGRTLAEASELLSDTLVRDVLGGGATTICIGDLGAHGRYSRVPSIVSLKLRSVLCVPMRMGERVLGAVYLGREAGAFADAHARDLKVLASMALPVLVQLKRATDRAASPIDELLVGESEPMARVRELVRRVAPSDLSVLILGETGTGKEVTARAIHAASERADQPLVALNCAAVPESLLAVELFGCKKGAYTGAVSDRQGRIEAADGSTLFLDEVGDMPISMQVALLRVLEDKKVTRVGENEERPVDFRLLAATSKDLDAEVLAGRFRVDLLYRLRELAVTLPPLRDRSSDVILLAQLFLRQAERQLGLGPRKLGRDAQALLATHAFPGNVRELRAVMRRACILADGDTIAAEHLQLDAVARPKSARDEAGSLELPLEQARDQFVIRYVSAVLDRHEGNREAAAAALGISVRSLYRYLSPG